MTTEERIARATVLRARLCGLVAEYAALERSEFVMPAVRPIYAEVRRDLEAILDAEASNG